MPEVIAFYLERNMARLHQPGRRHRGDRERQATYMRRRPHAARGRDVPEPGPRPHPAHHRRERRPRRLLRGRDRRRSSSATSSRIGGWMTRADLAAHRSEWAEPLLRRLPRRRRLRPAAQQPGPVDPADPVDPRAVRPQGAWASSRPPRSTTRPRPSGWPSRTAPATSPTRPSASAPLEWLNSQGVRRASARELIRPDRLMTRRPPRPAAQPRATPPTSPPPTPTG